MGPLPSLPCLHGSSLGENMRRFSTMWNSATPQTPRVRPPAPGVVGPKVDAARVASKLVNYHVGTDLLVSGDVVVRYVHPGTPYRWG